jgi:hypothetical protein
MPAVDEEQDESIQIDPPSWTEESENGQTTARNMNKWLQVTIGENTLTPMPYINYYLQRESSG